MPKSQKRAGALVKRYFLMKGENGLAKKKIFFDEGARGVQTPPPKKMTSFVNNPL